MKWKTQLHKQNIKHYAWPKGWDTAEQVADQLECGVDRVKDHLAPSIKNGEVECKQHTVWCEETGRKVIKTGFRLVSSKTISEKAEKTVSGVIFNKLDRNDRWPFYEGAKIHRPDSPRVGTVKKGVIHWSDGTQSMPKSLSSVQKLRLK